MRQSKLPLFAYVDETGNSGHNLFDEAQPDFFTAAFITRGDFDGSFKDRIQALAQRLGATSLHARELGMGRLETIAGDLLEIAASCKGRFFVSRVEKRYLLAAKIFDVLFDSGENAAVAWHHYNIRPLRIMLAMKLASLVTDDIAKRFWACVLEPKKERILVALPKICEELIASLGQLPDAGSRKILGDGLAWVIKYPETIHLHTDQMIAKQGHFPNMVAFANLLAGLEHLSQTVNRKVARITHDRQSEFEKTMAVWHSMYSNAPKEELRWAGETHSLQKVVGSTFEVKTDDESAGIQVADVVLWLYSRLRKGNEMRGACGALLAYALENGWESDFSFIGVEQIYHERYGKILAGNPNEQDARKALEILTQMEASRKASMDQFVVDKIPPFDRGRR